MTEFFFFKNIKAGIIMSNVEEKNILNYFKGNIIYD